MIEIKLDAAAWDGAQDATQALLEKWLVTENEKVKKGQALVTVVMVKATIDIEAPSDGYIEKILIP
ncbi:MAG: lipoyl domain-containing protein, partial [Burkholderiaceae bacterium]|nr:lipoyl domain-containing protein [Burkholderiaceae bacterium]